MAAGLKNGYVKFIKEADVLKWATPPPSAIVIATLPNSFHERAIFGFEKGAAWRTSTLPPRAARCSRSTTRRSTTSRRTGHALFDAVLLWTISPPAK